MYISVLCFVEFWGMYGTGTRGERDYLLHRDVSGGGSICATYSIRISLRRVCTGRCLYASTCATN